MRGVLGLLLVAQAGLAEAQSLADCRSETDSLRRLVCYDALRLSAVEGQSAAEAAGSRVLAAWRGSGAATPRPFDAAGPWEIQRDAGGFFQAFLVDQN
jgi:hypothetical protein